jgi:UDP-N-acetylmuramoyl-tripeptide--D-alanyl-D-alanine ligase
MQNFNVKDLINAIGGKFLLGDPNLQIRDISIDSRTIKKGQFFLALKGKNFDGHDFVKDAIEKEASGVVYSRDDIDFSKPFATFPTVIKVKDTLQALGDLAWNYRRRFKKIKVVGITGSNGKTTTKDMLASILALEGSTVFNRGNANNCIGLPLAVLDIGEDTEYAVFEMGTNEPGEIKTLTDITFPDVGIITNIGYSHLEAFGSLEGVFNEKRTLMDGISPEGFMVLNIDDPYLKSAVSKVYSKVITYGLYNGSDIYAKNLRFWPNNPVFEMHIGSKSVEINLPIKGRFNIFNALAAASAAHGLGVDINRIKEGIEKFTPQAMRMEVTTLPTGTVLINDAYNSNPSSVKESISSIVQAYPGKKVVVVLGDMLELGSDAHKFHSELGKFLDAQNISNVFLTGDMCGYIKENMKIKPCYYSLHKDNLLSEIEKTLDPKTVVLFKASRSMKLEEMYNNIILKYELEQR